METKVATTVKPFDDKKVTSLQKEAITFKILNPATHEKAIDILNRTQTAIKEYKADAAKILDPLNESLKAIKAQLTKVTDPLDAIVLMVKAEMLRYDTEQRKIAREENERLANLETERLKKLEKDLNSKKPEIAAKAEQKAMYIMTSTQEKYVPAPAKSFLTSSGSTMKVKMQKKVKIINESLIPKEYWTLNMVKVNAAVLKAGLKVPGTEIYEELFISR